MSQYESSVHTADDLIAAGLLPVAERDAVRSVASRYAVAITPAMAALIDRDDPADPIARQFLPDPRELQTTPEERADPIGDEAHSPVRGIVHRYPDRVLLKPLHVCPVYCRFCFRREVVGPGGAGALTAEELDAAMAYIAAHPAIWEVIVTGGDPLMLSPRRARDISTGLGAIDHVRIVRWHTRVPVVDPQRVTSALVDALVASGKTIWLAVHANHPRELTPGARAALARLADGGIALVSQTVLLRGVNDDVETLAALMRGFVESRVKPYYLHHADLAPGTSHFRTTVAEGQALVRALRGRLSGLAQPTYVLDIPGGHGKVPAAPGWVDTATDDNEGTKPALVVADPWGGFHPYPPRPRDEP